MADIRLSVGLQAASASEDEFVRQVGDIVKRLSWEKLPKVEVGITVSKGSLAIFKQELQNILNTITMGSGQPIELHFGNDFVTLKTQLKDVSAEYENTKRKLSEKIKVQIETGAIDSKLKEIEARANALKSRSDTLNSAMSIMSESAAVIKDEGKSPDERAAAYQRFAAAVAAATSEIRNLTSAEKAEETAAKKQENTRRAMTTTLSDAKNKLDQLRAAGKSNSTEFVTLSSAVEQAEAELEAMGSGGEISAETLEKLKDAAKGAGLALGEINNPLSMLQSRMMQMFGPAGVILAGVRAMKEMVKEAIDIDSSMAQLRIVTNESDQSYVKFGKDVAATAKEISASMTDLIDATTVYARLGYSLEDSSTLAKYTAMLQNVGDIDASSATDAITAITKAFNLSSSQIETIMNKLVIVGNNYPISVAQIAEGMNNAGSALSAAGNTFDQSVALLTAANTTVQDISKSSTGLRTIAARIRNTKVELDELGETVEEAKYEEVIKSLTDNGVKLTTLNGEYKSTYDILKDIAAIWGELNSMEQAAIAQQLAGTRQQNVFYSIINQFREAEGAMQDMQNSAGALDAAYSKYMSSIAAHTDKFKASFQSLSDSAVNSNLVKGIVDVGTTIVSWLEKLLGLFDGIGGAIMASGLSALLTPALVGGLVAAWKKAFAVVTSALGVANPWIVAIGAVLPAVIAGVSALVEKIKEANPTLEMINGQIAQAQSNISAYNRELDENSKRISEINSTSGQISDGEKAELEYLEMRNSLLRTRIELEEKLTEEKRKQAVGVAGKEAEEWLKGQHGSYEYTYSGRQTNNWVDGEGLGKLEDSIERYKSAEAALEELRSNADYDTKTAQKYIDQMEQSISDIIDLYESVTPVIDTLMNSGDSAMVALAYQISNAFSDVSDIIGVSQNEYDAFKQAVSSMPSDAIDEFRSGVEITADKIAEMRNESEEFDAWAKQFNYGTLEQTNEALAIYIKRLMDSTDAQDLATASVIERINSLRSLNDELAKSKMALEAYKAALAGGEKGDTLSAYADAYKAFLKDYEAGAIGSNAVRAAIELFIPDEVLANLDYDTQKAADLLSNNFMRRVFTDSDDYAQNFIDLIHGIFGEDTGGIVDIITNADGSTNILIDSYSRLATALGVDVEFVYALADAIDAYSKYAVMSREDTWELVKEIASISDIDWNGSVSDLEKFNAAVEHLAVSGLSAYDIADVLRSMEQFGFIDLSNISGWGAQIQDIINKIKEANGALDETDGESANPTVGINDQATAKLDAIDKHLDDIGSKVVKPTVDLQVTGSGSSHSSGGGFSGRGGKFASGTKSAPGGLSLVNELGPELISDNGHVYIAGGGEPTVTKLHKGAVVLTAEETARALRGASSMPKVGLANGTPGTYSVNMYDSGGRNDLGRYLIQRATRDVSDHVRDHLPALLLQARRDAEDAFNKDLTDALTNSNVGKGGGKGGGGGSEQIEDWFTPLYEEHQHLLKMDQESQQEYLDWLNGAYKKAYNQGLIELKDYRKYEEEVYKLQQDIFKDFLGDQEHLIKMEEAGANDPSVILNFYQNLINSVEKELQAAYDRGLDSTNDYVQTLQNKWVSYTNAIKDMNEDADKEAREAVKDLVDYRIKMLKQYIKDEQNALKERLSYLKDFYGKQKDLLQDEYDTEKYLEQQSEKRKSVSDIQAEIEQLRYDNSAAGQKRLLKLQKELADAQKDLADFEKDHALDTAKAELDKIYEKQEDEINKRLDELDAKLNNPKELYEQALLDVQNNSVALYQEMIEYNNRVGSGIETDIVDKWEEAYVSLKKYFDLYGEYYKDINLVNATGWYPGKDNAWSRTVPVGGYASGTSSARPGLHRVDENGAEWLFTSKDGNHYRLFGGGEKVLSASATDFLYGFASSGGQILSNLISRASSVFSPLTPAMAGGPSIEMGDIIINGNADQRTVSEIRRAQRDATSALLKEFGRLSKQS